MQHKKKILSVALMLGLGLTTLKAQTMNVRLQSGAQNAYELSDIQKVTFSGDQMQVQQTSSSTANYTLNDLRYVTFTDLTTRIETTEIISENLFLYPNPVVNELNIRLPQITSEYYTIEIYSLEGKKLYSQNISQCSDVYSLNVEFLNKGICICKLQTHNQVFTTKFIKN